MIFVFEVHVREGYTADQYAEAWVEASAIIQRATGARGTRLHRSPNRPDRLLAIASWESKALRDVAETARDPRVQRIIDAQAEHVDIRVVGEFDDPEWVVLPEQFDWTGWERRIRDQGVTLDRPRGSRHPLHAQIVYPIDYGYVNGTTSADGEEVDVFVGTADTGLVAVIHTIDHRKGDEEDKLLWNCTPEEIYLVNGFLNFDRTRMQGTLLMREPLERLWGRSTG